MGMIRILVLCAALTISLSAANDDKFPEAIKLTASIVKSIYDRWEVEKFPAFLKAVSMTHTSWEVLKVRISGPSIICFVSIIIIHCQSSLFS